MARDEQRRCFKTPNILKVSVFKAFLKVVLSNNIA
jgi:hypothetical protein